MSGKSPPPCRPAKFRYVCTRCLSSARWRIWWSTRPAMAMAGSRSAAAAKRAGPGSVEDDGPGIKPEQREHLFQPFVRGDSARSTSGTGLGLAIVQRIIDNHNGRLEIGSSERGGLLIRARLPVHRMLAPMKPAGELIAPAVSCSGCCTQKPGKPGFCAR